MVFLDFCLIIVVFYVATQIFIPLVWPDSFKINWLFRKSKVSEQDDLKYKINDLSQKKEDLDKQTDTVESELERKGREIKEMNQTLKNVKK